MDRFSAIVTRMDDAIWSMLLVALCLGVGLFLSLRMRFPQLRLLKEMGRVLKNGEEDGNGITPFQAFATTVGARVGGFGSSSRLSFRRMWQVLWIFL